MGSERMDVPPSQRSGNGQRSIAHFQDDPGQFSRRAVEAMAPAGSTVPKPRPTGFVVDKCEKVFAVERETRFFRPEGIGLQRCVYGSPSGRDAENHDWNVEGTNGTPSGDGSDDMVDGEDDDEQDEEDDADEGDGEVDGLVCPEVGEHKNRYGISGCSRSNLENMRRNNADLHEIHSSFGSDGGQLTSEDGNNGKGAISEPRRAESQVGHFDRRIAVSQPDLFVHEEDARRREVHKENGFDCGWRKDVVVSVDSGESVRTHLSDPITGVLMDDAMILSCGHSYGSGGLQHVTRMKACLKCQQPVSERKVLPNLALRLAVQAFRREEEMQFSKVSKRRRERSDQEKCVYDDPFHLDFARNKGVQFPFAVSDRVLIKGNKRTPQRFVGRIAVVTTQCLNGWYVVKTLDNAESVKLQYRSLAKVMDDPGSNITVSGKAGTPNWV